MSDVQKESFKAANQMGKVNILAEALDGNFKGLAVAVGAEYEGALRGADAAHGDFQESLGRLFTQSESWVKFTSLFTGMWKSIGKEIDASAPGIRMAISSITVIFTTAASTIRIAWNSLQLVFKSAVLIMNDAAAGISAAFAKITFGDISKRFKHDSDELRAESRRMRDSIGEDVDDMVRANNDFVDSLACLPSRMISP